MRDKRNHVWIDSLLQIGLPFVLSCTYRTKLRSRFGLIESPAPDWVTHCLCEWRALCQEYRELQHRGIDPSFELGVRALCNVLTSHVERMGGEHGEDAAATTASSNGATNEPNHYGLNLMMLNWLD
ncbi:unnamed protein product [Thlaspi arvense]|uniref:Uncharacterized protein n=1 Tax=Thlaspi arvense TaxID=13288 RepID=A0AAU9RL18_THLAR|nr:unnamed protein product [Thlaspi arvense]